MRYSRPVLSRNEIKPLEIKAHISGVHYIIIERENNEQLKKAMDGGFSIHRGYFLPSRELYTPRHIKSSDDLVRLLRTHLDNFRDRTEKTNTKDVNEAARDIEHILQKLYNETILKNSN